VPPELTAEDRAALNGERGDAAKIAAAFGSTVWCPRKGLRRLPPGLKARPYDPGDRLPGGARAFGVGVLCPDESAVLLPKLKALAVADGVIRRGKGHAVMHEHHGH